MQCGVFSVYYGTDEVVVFTRHALGKFVKTDSVDAMDLTSSLRRS